MTTSWTRQRADVGIERSILIGAITNDRVLRSLSISYKPRYFVVPYANTVMKWVLEYFQNYEKSPKADIQSIYEAHRRSGLDSEQAELVGKFLTSISEQYENEGNADYILDSTQEYFLERSLTILRDDLDERLNQGNLLAAKESIAQFIAPEKRICLGCEPLRDREAVRDAFTNEDELFTLPGDLGKLLGPFVREDAWGLVGSYKGGKSWMCYYIQDQALYSRLNVARFSFEMNKKKETRRFIQSICGMPVRPPRDGKLWLPVWDCRANQDDSCSKTQRVGRGFLHKNDNPRPIFGHEPHGYKPCAACRGHKGWQLETWAEEWKCDMLTWKTAWRKSEAISRQLRGARFKFQYWPMRSAGMPEVKATLQVWEHLEGFVPDVIVLDSPDIMRRAQGERHAIVENRQEAMALAQQYHSVLIAPFQAGSKEAIERKSKRRSDIGESVQILGDVDGMMMLDQSDSERESLRARVGVSVQRDDKSVLGNQVMVLQCIELGQAVVDSAFIQGER